MCFIHFTIYISHYRSKYIGGSIQRWNIPSELANVSHSFHNTFVQVVNTMNSKGIEIIIRLTILKITALRFPRSCKFKVSVLHIWWLNFSYVIDRRSIKSKNKFFGHSLEFIDYGNTSIVHINSCRLFIDRRLNVSGAQKPFWHGLN